MVFSVIVVIVVPFLDALCTDQRFIAVHSLSMDCH